MISAENNNMLLGGMVTPRLLRGSHGDIAEKSWLPCKRPQCNHATHFHKSRDGMVLAGVLVAIAMSAMIAAGLMYQAHSEFAAATAAIQSEQSYSAAMSGVHKALALLNVSRDDMASWYDNPEMFENQLVYDDGVNQWYFSVYSPAGDDSDSVRFGLTDESGKFNLNVAPKAVLAELNGMSGELVDCLIDYRDADDEAEPLGAEGDQYDFPIRNMPIIWTLEELLLIKGFDATIVYGEDANLNGLLDPNEDDSDETFPPDNNDGMLNRGLRNLLSAVNYDFDVDNSGKPRANINGNPQALAAASLGEQTTEFITVYRQKSGKSFAHPSDLLNMSYTYEEEVRGRRGRRTRRKKTIKSGVTAENLGSVLDRLTARTTNPDQRIR
ncbi:MAG TPA: hypothetical protein ENL03_06545, partial [Phycisphaerae bacterium]|nr:hypothetical protein [Phycisphaerae bacterium]